MFLTAQRPDADVIKGNVRDQLGLRVSLGNLSNDGYRMTFGQTDKEFQTIHDSDIGRGYISILGQYNEPILFDAPLMEQYDFVEDVKQILNKEDLMKHKSVYLFMLFNFAYSAFNICECLRCF